MPVYFEDIAPETVRMTRVIDTGWSEKHNKEMRKDKGWTAKRTLRHVAEIPFDEVLALAQSGDPDAIQAILRPSGEDDGAFRRLLRRHPEWRCSEGSI